MGSANSKAVRERIRSVNSTMHITRAMQLVASSKIKRAQAALSEGRVYCDTLSETFRMLAAGGADSPFLHENPEGRPLCILIAGDRGLAGGYNNNIFKAAAALAAEVPEILFLPVGRRAAEHCRSRGYETLALAFPTVEHTTPDDCEAAARRIIELFSRGECGRVMVLYTRYRNLLSQEVTVQTLLPAQPPEGTEETKSHEMIFEPSPDAVLSAVVPLYVSALLWGAVRESYASEIASRQNAMDSATKNASEMIDRLTLQYNRARQSAITGEITEIVAGAAAEQ